MTRAQAKRLKVRIVTWAARDRSGGETAFAIIDFRTPPEPEDATETTSQRKPELP